MIFDFDGVLLNSGEDGFKWAGKAREEKSRELGYDYSCTAGYIFASSSFEEMKKKVEQSPMSWQEFMEVEKAAAQRKLELVKRGQMELFPSARDVLENIGVPKAVVSNAYGDIVDGIVRQFGIDEHLVYWTAPRLDDIKRYHSLAKPETDMLDRAMKEIGSRDVIMVGDKKFDVQAAKNAGIESILVNSYGEDIDADPTYRVESLEEVLRIVG